MTQQEQKQNTTIITSGMTPDELVEKYLGKRVIVKDKGGIGVVYAILIRPDQHGPLLQIAFGKSDQPVPTLDDIYQHLNASELSCAPSYIDAILC